MTARIEKHVGESVADLPRRPEEVQVIPAVEDFADSLEHAIHGAREPRRDRFHAACEGLGAVRFDEEVRMIPLEGEVENAKLAPLTGDCEAPPELAHELARAEAR